MKKITNTIYGEMGHKKPVTLVKNNPVEALGEFMLQLISGKDIRPLTINGIGLSGVNKHIQDWGKKTKKKDVPIFLTLEILHGMVSIPPSINDMEYELGEEIPRGVIRACRRSILRDNFRPRILIHTDKKILIPTTDVAIWINKPILHVSNKTIPRHVHPRTPRPGLHRDHGPAVQWNGMDQWWINGDKLSKDEIRKI